MEIASPAKTALYLNAFDKNIQVDGVIKTFDDEYWVANIVPILHIYKRKQSKLRQKLEKTQANPQSEPHEKNPPVPPPDPLL